MQELKAIMWQKSVIAMVTQFGIMFQIGFLIIVIF